MKDAKRGFTDDTGWRINGESASMMGSDTDEATVYKSLLRHRNQEVRELIPSDQGGVMHNACSTKLAGITPGAICCPSSINPRVPSRPTIGPNAPCAPA